jgi:hypothetical protein
MPLQIDRRSRLGKAEFQSEYVARSQPVILTDAIAHWGARQKWDLDYFVDNYPDKQVTFDRKSWRLGDFIAQLAGPHADGMAPYLKEVKLDEQFPELWADVGSIAAAEGNLLDSRLLPRSMRLDRGKTALFIGAKGSGFRKLHFDYSYLHVFISQVHGPKDAILFPPSDTRYLYPNPEQDNQSLIPDPYAVDPQRFPEFAKADPTRLTIAEGETLFLPAGWWHATQINQPSIAIAESALDRHNWKQRANWYARSHARAGVGSAKRKAIGTYMKLIGLLLLL